MRRILLIISLLCALQGCRTTTSTCDIDLAAHLGDPRMTNVLNDIASDLHVIEIGNSDSLLLARAFPVCRYDDVLYFDNKGEIYSADLQTGEILNSIGKKGRGPGEYVDAGSVSCSPSGDTILVCDVASKKILAYDKDGNSRGVFPAENVSGAAFLPDGNVVVTNSYSSDKSNAFSICDGNGNLVREGGVWRNGFKTYMIYLDQVAFHDGVCYYRKALNDTLFAVTKDAETLNLTINEGKYRIPDEKYASGSAMQDVSSGNYIRELAILRNSSYAFISYWVSNVWYTDIWDLKTKGLLYRNKMRSSPFGTPGFAVRINGKESRALPRYLDDEYMICEFLRPKDAQAAYPQYDDNSNPLLLVMELK